MDQNSSNSLTNSSDSSSTNSLTNSSDSSSTNSSTNSSTGSSGIVNWFQNMQRRNISIGIFGGLVGTQIVTKRLGYATPSYYFGKGSDIVVRGFINGGEKFVDYSSELTKFFSIKDLTDAIFELGYPIVTIIMSPYNLFQGVYLKCAASPHTSLLSIGTGLTVLTVGTLLAQHYLPEKAKPSTILTKVSDNSAKLFRYFGQFFADISSFYRYFKLDKVIDDGLKIADPLWKLLTVPFQFVTGYIGEVFKSNRSRVVIAGSLTLCLLYMFGFRRTSGKFPLFSSFPLFTKFNFRSFG